MKTDNATENAKKFINKNKTGNRRYYELGELYMNNIVVSNKEIHQVGTTPFSLITSTTNSLTPTVSSTSSRSLHNLKSTSW